MNRNWKICLRTSGSRRMRRCPSPLVSMKVPWVRFSPTARPMAMGVSLSLRSWKTSAGMVFRAARLGAL